ncbi:MAG: tRNA guanosine(15) transglycosylase TgtA [Candidatus Freyarchaeota archaeon]|nr:tRNA guanosine(15) transglycosylase TgtA [Candidatus Jordarchaeia archaeon]
MSFEVRERDLMGRIGILETKSGKITTPALLPVVNPTRLVVPPSSIRRMGCECIITNAMITLKRLPDEARSRGIHGALDFNGVIMTDSGAYQLMVYGELDINQEDIIRFQEEIGSDIAVILDVPSGGAKNREEAEEAVKETLLNAEKSLSQRRRSDILWVGPVQGSPYPDIVKLCAAEIGKMPFNLYAIGSVVQLMESYSFDVLVDVVMAAKQNLPLEKPVHLFGAGHPMMFSLAVAMGVDLFDSAAYALYARDGRYMTPYGTQKFSELKYFPCSCPICLEYTPQELIKEPEHEREKKLAIHNLYVSLSEVQAIRQAIIDGRLWELLEARSRSHPSLLEGLRRLCGYSRYVAKFNPSIKKRAILFFSSESIKRPEVSLHLEKLEKLPRPDEVEVLVILPEPSSRPFYRSKERRILERSLNLSEASKRKIQFAFKSSFFGLIPEEVEDVYPLSQHLGVPDILYAKEHIASAAYTFIERHDYKLVVFPVENDQEDEKIEEVCRRKGIVLTKIQLPEKGRKKWKKLGEALTEIMKCTHPEYTT